MRSFLNWIYIFALWIGGIDVRDMGPPLPRSAALKAAIPGYAAIVTAIIAGAAWVHAGQFFLGAGSSALTFRTLFGLLMGCAMICVVERPVLATLRPNVAPLAKGVAITWRAALALVDASVVVLPIALSVLEPQIEQKLSAERLNIMESNRTQLDRIYQLANKTDGLAAIVKDEQTNRTKRETVPANVRSLLVRFSNCMGEERSLRKQMEVALADAAATGTGRADSGEGIAYWRDEIAATARVCTDLERQANSARGVYFADLDGRYRLLQAKRDAAQSDLDNAQTAAKQVTKDTDDAAKKQATTNLGGLIHGLSLLVADDEGTRNALICFYLLFFAVFLMPMTAKLAGKNSAHEKHLTADEEKYTNEREAELHESGASLRGRKLEADGEVSALQVLAEGHDSHFIRRARERAEFRAQKERISRPSDHFIMLCGVFRDVRDRLAQMEQQFGDDPRFVEEIEALRAACQRSFRETANSISRDADRFKEAAE
jgi:hypothetical protein